MNPSVSQIFVYLRQNSNPPPNLPGTEPGLFGCPPRRVITDCAILAPPVMGLYHHTIFINSSHKPDPHCQRKTIVNKSRNISG